MSSSRPILTGGFADIISGDKVIDTDTDTSNAQSMTKVVKLRFTRKQYDAFCNACMIFQVVSSDSKFVDFTKSVLGSDVKTQTIGKQLVQPILEAPMRVPLKVPKAQEGEKQAKSSYFTAPTKATNKCIEIYNQIKDEDADFKQDIHEGNTCVTDVRIMISKYILKNDLRNEQGTILDNFLCNLAPRSISNNSDQLHRIDGHLVIPKGNRKVITDIVNEITFDK